MAMGLLGVQGGDYDQQCNTNLTEKEQLRPPGGKILSQACEGVSVRAAGKGELDAGFAIDAGCRNQIDLIHRDVAALRIENGERVRRQQVIVNLLAGAAVLEDQRDRSIR